MRILFLNPPFLPRFSRASRSPAVAKGGTLYYPIWLAYATGLAEQAGHEVRLVDAPAAGIDMEGVFDHLGGFKPELIVADSSTPTVASDARSLALCKQRYPDAYTVLVGTHPSALPRETLELETAVDAVAVGEYDHTIIALAAVLAGHGTLSAIPGLLTRRDPPEAVPAPREKIIDLDSIPFVSDVYRRHLHVRDYFFAAAGYPMLQIMTGRGCPHRCFFCVYPQTFHGRRYRTRSPENVAAEFASIRDQLPLVRELGIEDDCFTADRQRAARVSELLVAQGNRLLWYCNVRGDVPLELLRLMRAAGCRLVTVGFESGSQKILDGMHKGATVEGYRRFAKDAKRAGLLVHGCLMAGNPGDNRETLEESYRFAVELNCDSMQFYPLYVYPGTEAYVWAKESGILATEDYRAWLTPDGLHNCVISTADMNGGELLALCDTHLTRYHLRPRYLAMKLRQAVTNPREGLRSLKSARVFFGKLLTGKLAEKR